MTLLLSLFEDHHHPSRNSAFNKHQLWIPLFVTFFSVGNWTRPLCMHARNALCHWATLSALVLMGQGLIMRPGWPQTWDPLALACVYHRHAWLHLSSTRNLPSIFVSLCLPLAFPSLFYLWSGIPSSFCCAHEPQLTFELSSMVLLRTIKLLGLLSPLFPQVV